MSNKYIFTQIFLLYIYSVDISEFLHCILLSNVMFLCPWLCGNLLFKNKNKNCLPPKKLLILFIFYNKKIKNIFNPCLNICLPRINLIGRVTALEGVITSQSDPNQTIWASKSNNEPTTQVAVEILTYFLAIVFRIV